MSLPWRIDAINNGDVSVINTLLPLATTPSFAFSRRPGGRGLRALCLVLGACLLSPAQAAHNELKGTYFESTRVIYPETARQGKSIVLNNNDDRDFLLQAYISPPAAGGLPGAPTQDFLVTPPISRLNAHQVRTLRVLRTGGAFPSDRESVFYLTAILIPSEAPPEAKHAVPQAQVKYRTGLSIKVFWRPQGLDKPNAVEAAAGKLTAAIHGDTLTLSNPTPYYVTLRTLSIGGVNVPATSLTRMVPPLGHQDWTLPAGTKRAAVIPVIWTAIKENGFDTTPFLNPAAVSGATTRTQ